MTPGEEAELNSSIDSLWLAFASRNGFAADDVRSRRTFYAGVYIGTEAALELKPLGEVGDRLLPIMSARVRKEAGSFVRSV